jgi:uncharacterized protein YejL (UPF0352 family)
MNNLPNDSSSSLSDTFSTLSQNTANGNFNPENIPSILSSVANINNQHTVEMVTNHFNNNYTPNQRYDRSEHYGEALNAALRSDMRNARDINGMIDGYMADADDNPVAHRTRLANNRINRVNYHGM